MSKKNVIIEINSDWLKIAEIETNKNICSINKLSVKRVDIEHEQIRQNLLDLIKESNIKTKIVTTYIPRYLLTIRSLELPSVDPVEIKNMVNLQVGKETPYSKDEIISDYKVSKTDKEGFSRVLLVIIRRDIVNSYLNLMKSINIHVDKIALSSEGLLNWYIAHRDEANKTHTAAFCDIDYSFTDFNIISMDDIVFSRSIAIGTNQLVNDTMMWETKFIDEIKLSIDIYHQEGGLLNIDEIILSCSDNDIPGLRSAINSELGLSIKIVEPFSGIHLSERGEKTIEAAKGISFSALIGIAYGQYTPTIDLTPQETKLNKDLEDRTKDFMFMGIALLFIFIISIGIFYKNISDKEEIINKLNMELEKTDKDAKLLELMIDKNNVIKKRKDTKLSALTLFDELYNVVPDEVYFNSITFEDNKNMILRGAASSMSHIFKFITVIEGLPYFQNVKTKYATKRKVKDKELTDFEIVCPIVLE